MELKFKYDHSTPLGKHVLLSDLLQKWFSNCAQTQVVRMWGFLFSDFLALIYWGSGINCIEKEFYSLSNLRNFKHDLHWPLHFRSILLTFFFFLVSLAIPSCLQLIKIMMIACSSLPSSLERCHSPAPHLISQTSSSGSCSSLTLFLPCETLSHPPHLGTPALRLHDS